MWQNITFVCMAMAALAVGTADAGEITGNYMEARTCQVYTGPCFANGEVGLAGKDAVMAWGIERGSIGSVDLSGLGIALVVRSSDTLGFRGLQDARTLRTMAIVDQSATPEQRAALVHFVKQQTNVQLDSIQSADIDLQLDVVNLQGKLNVGSFVQLEARKARPDDCICSNESAYYPPLAELKGFVPGVTIEGDVNARALGTHWSIPDSRTAYLGTFVASDAPLATVATNQ